MEELHDPMDTMEKRLASAKATEEHPLAKALRDHLKALLNQPMTVKSARDVRRVVDSAMSLLMTISGVDGQLENAPRPAPGSLGGYGGISAAVPVSVSDLGGWTASPVINGDLPVGATEVNPPLPIVPSSAAENFGTTAIRELISAVASIRKAEIDARNPSKELTLNDLVDAMAKASNSGCTDIAELIKKDIKKRLGTQEELVGVGYTSEDDPRAEPQ